VKNWPAEKFISLAVKLKDNGYGPVFTVSPTEREEWLEHPNCRFHVPCFSSLSQLADFYQDARLLIGNDSGSAHLASYVGMPRVQILRR
jgi:heptosyltransferase-3